jgi:hypothetical protein
LVKSVPRDDLMKQRNRGKKDGETLRHVPHDQLQWARSF